MLAPAATTAVEVPIRPEIHADSKDRWWRREIPNCAGSSPRLHRALV
jgi:hypothetical protein